MFKDIVAVADWDTLGFWNVTQGKFIAKNNLQSHSTPIVHLKFAEDGTILTLGDSSGKLYKFINNPPYFTIGSITRLG